MRISFHIFLNTHTTFKNKKDSKNFSFNECEKKIKVQFQLI